MSQQRTLKAKVYHGMLMKRPMMMQTIKFGFGKRSIGTGTGGTAAATVLCTSAPDTTPSAFRASAPAAADRRTTASAKAAVGRRRPRRFAPRSWRRRRRRLQRFAPRPRSLMTDLVFLRFDYRSLAIDL